MSVKKPKAEEEVITEAVVAEEPAKPILEPQVVEPEPPVREDVPPAVAVAPEEPKKEGGWIWMLVAFVLGAVVGTVTGYVVAKTQNSKLKTQDSTTAQTSPTPSPSPATTTIKRADLSVQVLNGSGVAGAAAKAKTFLEGLGYANVTAGNADGDFAETEVEIKADKISAKEMVVGDLEDEYTLSETVGELDADSDYDIVITLGAE